jgi:hypothetical protein
MPINYRSLVPGGFFSSNPATASINPVYRPSQDGIVCRAKLWTRISGKLRRRGTLNTSHYPSHIHPRSVGSLELISIYVHPNERSGRLTGNRGRGLLWVHARACSNRVDG